MKTFALAAALFTLAATAQAQSASYAIDPTHTFVSFEIGHFGTSTNRGRWDKKEGTVQFDRAGKTGKVDITLDMTSISTGVAPFDGHLKSPEFFNVAQHPTGKFVSERFVFNGDKVAEVQGTLTLLGKSNPVSFKASNFNCYNSPMLKREVADRKFNRPSWRERVRVSGLMSDCRLPSASAGRQMRRRKCGLATLESPVDRLNPPA